MQDQSGLMFNAPHRLMAVHRSSVLIIRAKDRARLKTTDPILQQNGQVATQTDQQLPLTNNQIRSSFAPQNNLCYTRRRLSGTVAVAQRQSTALWMRGLWVRNPSATLFIFKQDLPANSAGFSFARRGIDDFS